MNKGLIYSTSVYTYYLNFIIILFMNKKYTLICLQIMTGQLLPKKYFE